MTAIPDFKSPQDKHDYYEIFEEKLQERAYLISKTVTELFPGRKLETLDSKAFKIIHELTESLLYQCTEVFEEDHPEYKSECDVFIPRASIKEAVKDALTEFKDSADQVA